MTTKRIDTTLHYVQYIIARIILIGGFGFLVYSIWTQKMGAIIFCSLFVIYTLILIKRVFNKPTVIEFDDGFIYLDHRNYRIDLNDITGIKKNRILYNRDGIDSSLKLPNFYFVDKKWTELKELINKKNNSINDSYNSGHN